MRPTPFPLVLSPRLLTPRELEVLHYVAQGLTNKEIALHLCLGETTIASHLKTIFLKLHVHTRAQAVQVSHEQGLLSRGTRP